MSDNTMPPSSSSVRGARDASCTVGQMVICCSAQDWGRKHIERCTVCQSSTAAAASGGGVVAVVGTRSCRVPGGVCRVGWFRCCTCLSREFSIACFFSTSLESDCHIRKRRSQQQPWAEPNARDTCKSKLAVQSQLINPVGRVARNRWPSPDCRRYPVDDSRLLLEFGAGI